MLTPSDKSHVPEILADTAGVRFHNFNSLLLRLCAKADAANRELLRELFPDAVEAVEAFKAGKLAVAR